MRISTDPRKAKAGDLLVRYREAKQAVDRAESELRYWETELLDYMQEVRMKTVSLESEDKQFTATYTQRTNNKIDEKGLRKALTAKVFDKYTKKVLDKTKLEHAMSDGDVDPAVVARFVEQVPGKRYLTFREKDKDAAEDL